MINIAKLNQIISLARKCNDCAMLHFTNFSRDMINLKIDNSPVTIADLAVNHLAINGLQKIFPDIKIISEESNKSQKQFKNNAGVFPRNR